MPLIRVALPPREPRRARVVRGHPDLAEAAAWFLENNRLQRPSGFGAVKHLVGYRCQNPECGRRLLRVEAHHVHWVRHGGADDPWNAVVLCPSCHKRCVHTSDERIRVSRALVEGHEALLWEYRDRPPVLQFRQPPGRDRCSPSRSP